MTTTLTQKRVTCRYRRRNDEMCTGEALDSSPDAEIVICTKHAALVLKLVTEARRAVTKQDVADTLNRTRAEMKRLVRP